MLFSKLLIDSGDNLKVFLGGTINGSRWRDEVIDKISIDYFNPVVDEWNDDDVIKEEHEKEVCDYLLFVITPLMGGVYSIAEAVDSSNKCPGKTIFCVLDEDDGNSWSESQLQSLNQVKRIVKDNGAIVLDNLDEVILFLNGGDLV